MNVQNIWSNQIQFLFIWFELLWHLILISILFLVEIHDKHNIHSQFWKQCHKVATIQNKMCLWFCINLWFLKYCSIAMHWLTLEISLHYNVNSTSSSFTSSPHTPWSKLLFSPPFLFFGTFCTFNWNINSSTSSSLPFKIMSFSMWQQMTTSKRYRIFRFDLIKNSLHIFLSIPKKTFIVILAWNKPIINAFSIKCHIPICLYGIINHGNNKYPLSSIT